jgi:hypothetical protein
VCRLFEVTFAPIGEAGAHLLMRLGPAWAVQESEEGE